MVSFRDDRGHPCNIDDPEWTCSITRETPESISVAYLSYHWAFRVKEEAWERTNIEQESFWCRESMSSISGCGS